MSNDSITAKGLRKIERRSLLFGKHLVQRMGYCSDAALKQVLFVAGVQRSGTNMIMDVLERSFTTDVYHERDSRAFKDYLMRSPTVIRALFEKSHASHVVIKAICELQRLSVLMGEFERAKTVWVVRHYHDVVNSMLVSWKRHAMQIRKIIEDPSSAGWRGEGMSRSTHMLLQDLFHPDMSNASSAALIWYFRNILFFEQQFERDPRVLLVFYEDLVTSRERAFRRVFEFAGLDYTKRVSSKVFASSIRKRNAPVLEPAVTAVCEELWKRFGVVFPD